jgi:polyhydroxyalkanoate synthesis regulator phasin
MVAQAVRQAVSIPMGLCLGCLNYEEALTICKISGGQFFRSPIFVDTVMNYNGVINPCSTQVINYRKDGDMSDETAKRIRDDAETMKASGNKNIWELRHPYDKEHEGEEYIEGKVIQTLREEVETLSHSVLELKDEIKTMKRRHAIHITDIYARTLWQRIVNKTVEP